LLSFPFFFFFLQFAFFGRVERHIVKELEWNGIDSFSWIRFSYSASALANRNKDVP